MSLGRSECKANDAANVKRIMPEIIWLSHVAASDISPISLNNPWLKVAERP